MSSLKINTRTSFTTEDINEFIKNSEDESQLVKIVLDHIRNGYEITEELFLKIKKMDCSNKMKIIREFQRVYTILCKTIENM
jgi:hypothetical protein